MRIGIRELGRICKLKAGDKIAFNFTCCGEEEVCKKFSEDFEEWLATKLESAV